MFLAGTIPLTYLQSVNTERDSMDTLPMIPCSYFHGTVTEPELPLAAGGRPACRVLLPGTRAGPVQQFGQSTPGPWQISTSPGRKGFYLTTHSTHFIYGYLEGKEGKVFI